MNMKFKAFIVILVFFGFSTTLFAKPVTYSFSGFGGGLPSSAYAGADTATSKKIIIEDDDENDDYNDDYYNDEPTVKKGKKTTLIVTGVVVGLVAVAGVIFGTYYFANQSGECCAELTDNFIQGCGEGCGEACAQGMDQACSESLSSACSSNSSTITCSEASIGAIFGNGLQIIPIFIP